MEAVVSDIIRSRMQEPGGFKETAMASLVLHAGLLTLLVFLSGVITPRRVTPTVVMNISLGGSPGPRTGGLTPIGGRAIQPAPPTTSPRVERTALPTPPQQTAMVLPDPKAKPRTPPRTPAKPAAANSKPTPAGATAEAQAGSARAETGVKGMGFGLSSSGGGGTGGYLDVQNFCCPEYLTDMIDRIRSRWNQQQRFTGIVLMKFTILRNGAITDIEYERRSNIPPLDLESQRALTLTRLAPLPVAFPDDHLTVHLSFEYEQKR